MASLTMNCPHCGERITLTEAITASIREALRKEVEEEVQKEAETDYTLTLAALEEQVKDQKKQLKTAHKQELELLKRQRDLEAKEETLELELARKLDKERNKIQEEAVAMFEEQHRIKDREKEKQLSNLRRQIKDLERKSEQGSQQLQGAVAEDELKDILSANFAYDQIEPVGKGIKGADVLQRVYTRTGQHCGTIIWESKNTKNWNASWITKLKDDMRVTKAQLAVIASTALPKGVSQIGEVDGVWVTGFGSVIGLACVLRANLIEVASVRSATEGKSEKMEVLYHYLSGSEFRQRVEGMVEPFVAMREDLDHERQAMERIWAKREQQIRRVAQSIAGMYGDMQGIIGTALPSIERLELPPPSDYEGAS